MNWKKVTININKMTSDAVMNIMKDLGAQGVVVEDTSIEYTDIIAYYPAMESFPQLLQSLKSRVKDLSKYDLDVSGWKIQVETTSDENWATSWHKYFKPMKIGNNFEICPAWMESKFSCSYLIKIYPGRAFGIGGHESTQLALINMENHLKSYFENLQNIKMMDIGTGTGILAIAAARMGVGYIYALDKDEAAIQAAKILQKYKADDPD
ncbi:MAG: 50S ribosomal protein L11 methyltransferase, partial [Bacillota bacterium]